MRILSILFVFISAALFGQSTLYTNATIHIGNGEKIEKGFLQINADGLIEAVGEGAGPSDVKTVVNLDGKHIYPGIIAPNSTLGLQEIGAVRATRDLREIGKFTPNVRSKVAFNTDSEILPTITCNGVLVGQITPRGGFVSGSSSVMYLDERNWEEASISSDEGVHVYLPSRYRRSGWWANPGPITVNKNYEKDFAEIKNFLNEAKAYNEAQPLKKNISLAAMKSVFEGQQKVYLHTESAQAFMDAAIILKEMGISKLVWIGAYEADQVSDYLVANNIPVLLRRTHELPMFDDDAVDKPFFLAKTLTEKGVLVGLENSGDMEQMNTRNLPYLAGTLMQYGWTAEQALSLITLNSAKILGVDAQLGSIEKGKHATFFISTGNALEMAFNGVEMAFIKGRQLDFSKNRQLQLYNKYHSFYKE